ncbi:MAG: polymer-forming cytoskeletal protein [Candidatus Omnitrophica bacterium]|nr:polymer-forming cytoskeletal protein [Candidatus Omnitrophota bacterium]
MIGKRAKRPEMEEKQLDVDASMQGNMVFKDPVNLKINGTFEGSLTTKGNLTIGETADVNADIIGENIIIAGRVTGDIIAEKTLKLVSPAKVTGDIKTPNLVVEEGTILHGYCHMIFDEAALGKLNEKDKRGLMSLEEVAAYLEVDPATVSSWADSGRLRGKRESSGWKFEKALVDEWVKNEKIK